MSRTFAVLLLLLGLATATPVVCLCAPSGAALASVTRQETTSPAAFGAILQSRTSASGTAPAADAPSMIAASAAAVVATLIATAGGLPSTAPWRLPRPVTSRQLPSLLTVPGGPSWSPAVPPPR